MKKLLYFLSIALFSNTSAQVTLPSSVSSTENYIYSRTYLEATSTSSSTAKQVQGITYFDGLGRPKQSITIKATPLGNDLVTPVEYDEFGRQEKDFLPLPQTSTGNGAINSSPDTSFYSGFTGANLYSKKKLELSPLDRLQEQGHPGTDWNIGGTHTQKFEYEANTNSDVIKFVTTTTWSNGATSSSISITPATDTNATGSGYYKENQLYKNKITDEDGNVSYEFKNGQGQTLLVRKVLSSTENTDTYYVYNEYDQLAFVIPPLAANNYKTSPAGTIVSPTDLDQLCYQYHYDGQNRLVEKKLPGKDWEYMVYDQQDRLVMTQDSNLGRGVSGNTNLPGKQWLFTKYDQFGRVAYTGIYTSAQEYGSPGRASEQTSANGAGINHVERKSTVGFTQNGLEVYYGDPTGITTYPSSLTTLLSVNYYDTYPALPSGVTIPTAVLGQNVLTQNAQSSNISTKSLPTASMVKNIEDDNWTKNFTWYDTKARPIGSYSQNHLGGHTKTESKIDFSGVPTETYTYHKRRSTDSETIIKETFEYDNQNRLLKHWHNVNNAATDELLTENQYNELGQLKSKKVGGSSTSPLQTIDYQYNIRGWMTGINLDASGNIRPDQLFSYKINYQNPLEITNTSPYLANSSLTVAPRYNGNISEVTWHSGTDATEPIKKYGYVYDGLNRLLAGFYYKKSSNNYLFTEENNEIPEYDLNGNITKLKRFAYLESTAPNKIDDLTYTYTGNRLTNLSDAGNSSGYENLSSSSIQYDNNGNMTDMPGKGINTIGYNYLNLPSTIQIATWEDYIVNYLYRADGTKVKKTNALTITGINGSTTTTTTIDYLGGFQYKKIEKSFTRGNGDEILDSFGSVQTGLAMESEAYMAPSDDRIDDPIDPPVLVDPDLPEESQALLQFVPTSEGFYDFERNLYIYQYKDHLGNVRISYSKNQSGIGVDVQDQNDYYPFGMNHLRTSTAYFGTGSWMNYKYNGKELQETGMYDYGWRQYMPDVGRWMHIDPLAENFNKYSPYNYVKNTPINGFDPDGRDVIILNDSKAVGRLGHAAVIVGNSQNGWYYYSMNGTTVGDSEKGNAIGESKVPDKGTPLGVGLSPQQAMLKANTINPNKTHNYDRFIVLKTTKEEDEKIKEKANNAASKDTYKVIGQSCQNVVLDSYNELLNLRANGAYIMEDMPLPNAFFNSLSTVIFLDNLFFIPKENEIKISKTPILTVEIIPGEKF